MRLLLILQVNLIGKFQGKAQLHEILAGEFSVHEIATYLKSKLDRLVRICDVTVTSCICLQKLRLTICEDIFGV